MRPMQSSEFETVRTICTSQAAIADTVAYLQKELIPILRQNEAVLICFPHSDPTGLGAILGHAVSACGGRPIFWEDDLRWKELLRLAFLSRASTIIGTPLTLLGLSKLAAYQRTPLSIVNAITTGYPCLDWMQDGITRGLDCEICGILSPKLSGIVSGFSCKQGRGIHLREELFDAEITPESEIVVSGGRWGYVQVFLKSRPELKVPINGYAVISQEPCACGRVSTKLINMDYGNVIQAPIYKIMEDLLYWNSVLDCRAERTEHGLELEVVTFPGLQLPKLPSCAKLTMRSWNPETDVPIEIAVNWKP